MNVKNKLFTLLFILVISILIFSHSLAMPEVSDFFRENTSLTFEYITREQGLSNLSVSSMVEDKYGFLWFATQSGLNYYDGKEIEVIRNNPFKDNGLVHNLIQTMYYDEDLNDLWLGTYHGLSHYDIDSKKFVNYTVEDNNISNSVIIAITKDSSGNIWAGTMKGLSKIDSQTKKVTNFPIEGDTVRSLYCLNEELLIGTYQGLYAMDLTNYQQQKVQLNLSSEFVMTIDKLDNENLVLGLWGGGVVEIDYSKKEVLKEHFPKTNVYSFLQTDDGSLWAGTWGQGLYVKSEDEEVLHFSGNDQQLSHPVVYSLMQNRSGIMWIGTNGGGICKVNPRKSNYVILKHNSDEPLSISNGKINVIYQDEKDKLYLGIYNQGLNVFETQEKSLKKFSADGLKGSLPDNQITTIIPWHNNEILLGTNKGLVIWDKIREAANQWNIVDKDTMVYALASNDERLWIGSYQDGLYSYDLLSDKLTHYHQGAEINKISDNLIYDILIDSQERVWIATNNGLNMLDKNASKFKLYFKEKNNYQQLASNTIRTLFEDSKGRIWIGTVSGGLSLYIEDGDEFKTFTEAEGLSSNVVMGILEDENSNLWIATQNGLSILDPESGEVYILTPDDGIGGWEFNAGHYKDQEGNLLFGSIEGVIRIPANFTSAPINPPPLYITNVDIYQEPLDVNRLIYNNADLKLSYEDNFIGFRVVALDYDSPQKLKYYYKLEGFDEEWVATNNRDYISYSNLEPGNYTLKVKAETLRNIQTDIESLTFTISTPWYLGPYAFIAYGLLIIILIYVIYKIWEATVIERKNKELAILNNKLESANEELAYLSERDALTGLYNRRSFDKMSESKLQLAIQKQLSLSILMMDIDRFKDINDKFGHVAADQYLIDIAQKIKSILTSSTDFVARYGGDEFAIVLLDTNLEEAETLAKKIKESLSKIEIRPEYKGNDTVGNASVSIGLLSIIPDNNDNISELIQLADRALYQAKEEGRDKIKVSNVSFD